MGAATVSAVLGRAHQVPPQAWRAAAACADPDLDPAFRAVFTTDDPTDFDHAAHALCAGRPVMSACDAHARGVAHIAGIWAGRRRGVQGRPVASARDPGPR